MKMRKKIGLYEILALFFCLFLPRTLLLSELFFVVHARISLHNFRPLCKWGTVRPHIVLSLESVYVIFVCGSDAGAVTTSGENTIILSYI